MIKKVILMISKNIGLRCLTALTTQNYHQYFKVTHVITIDDHNDTRSKLNEIKLCARRLQIPILIAHNRDVADKTLLEMKPDLCLVAGWYWLIDGAVLDRIHCVGIHFSLLPKYRGGSPVVWAIINNEKYTGVSIFSMRREMDSGPILAQRSLRIGLHDHIGGVLNQLESMTLATICESIVDIVNRHIALEVQCHNLASYCAQRYPEDGKIDWTKPAREIYNFIRAQSTPYPGAFTLYNNNRITIWDAYAGISSIYYGTAGQVAWAHKTGKEIAVVCGDQHILALTDYDCPKTILQQIRSNRTRFH